MKKLMLAPIFLACAVQASDTLISHGVTCDIPEGYNSGPYDPVWNPKGMEPFCVFPSKAFADALTEQLENCANPTFVPPDLPECQQLVVSPNVQEYPCYEIKYE